MTKKTIKTVVVGTVRKPHGLGGMLKVQGYTDDPALFSKHKRFLIDGVEHKVVTLTAVNDGWLLKLKGCETPEDAAKFRGKALSIERDKIKSDSPLVEDYMGLAVRSPEGQPMGFITAYVSGGTHGLFEVTTAEGARLIPVSLEYFGPPDLEDGHTTMTPEGQVLLLLH